MEQFDGRQYQHGYAQGCENTKPFNAAPKARSLGALPLSRQYSVALYDPRHKGVVERFHQEIHAEKFLVIPAVWRERRGVAAQAVCNRESHVQLVNFRGLVTVLMNALAVDQKGSGA